MRFDLAVYSLTALLGVIQGVNLGVLIWRALFGVPLWKI